MSALCLRPARLDDLSRLTEIYNHYVVHSPATFDLEPKTLEQRYAWFTQFAATGRHRLLVAEEGDQIFGYAGTTRWRAKPAYDTTVEATVYCAADVVGKGIGTQLYGALLEAIAGEPVHRIVGGYVPPNEASAKLHERFGFRTVGVFSEVGYKFGRYWDVCWVERRMETA